MQKKDENVSLKKFYMNAKLKNITSRIKHLKNVIMKELSKK